MAKKNRYFEVIVGSHYDLANRKYSAGEIVADPSDLTAKFAGKFKEVTGPIAEALAAKEEASAPSPAPAPDSAKDSTAGTALVESALGADVTAQFPEAVAADLKVFKKGKKFFVATPEKADTAINKAALNEGDVVEFIAEQTA